jgi:hypothetical protein
MIVGGGVQQVSEFFFRRPLGRSRFEFDLLGWKSPQAARYLAS